MRNQHLTDLTTVLRNRYAIESTSMTTGQWLCANTVHKGRRFSFDGYRFQEAIANDLHPEMDVMKISQVGLSEIQQRKALALLVRNQGITGIFSLPNERMYRRFSQTRIKPLIQENPVFRGPDNGEAVRSMETMQFGRSFLHVVNATEGSATSISADFVFVDEVDLSDSRVVALFSSRLQNSTLRIKQRFSTPTWTGVGIDGGFQAGDQREYLCRCSACTHWQLPQWDHRWVKVPGLSDSVALDEIDAAMAGRMDLSAALVVCEQCGAPLDLDSPSREWVATYPSRTHARGYRVLPFTSGRIDIAHIITELLQYKRRDFLRGWYNTVLGQPYTEEHARLTEEQIRACLGNPVMPQVDARTPVFIGIDVGLFCHLVLATVHPEDKVRVFDFRVVRASEIVEVVRELCGRYNVVSGACDRYPYTPTAEAVMEASGGRVVPVEFRGQTDLKPVFGLDHETVTHWQGMRTRAIDAAAARVRARKFQFEGFGIQQHIILSHLRDMVRDETPEQPAIWRKLTGQDHYFHALTFLCVALRIPGVLDQIGGERDDRIYPFIRGMPTPLAATGLLGFHRRGVG